MLPSVKIDVDENTGVWETDGFPMVYVPRHFMLNIHNGVESALGREAYKQVLTPSGARAAYRWCEQQAESGRVEPLDVFAFYLERLSARGWGQLRIDEVDLEGGSATITMKNSIYVLGAAGKADQPVCYMFEGFFVGGIEYLARKSGIAFQSVRCEEVQCAAMGHENCVFKVHIA